MAPLARTHEMANGIDFNLNVMNTSPSRISQSGFIRSPHAGSVLARGGGHTAPPPFAVPAKAFGLVRLNYW
jgi:hypothetical protein